MSRYDCWESEKWRLALRWHRSELRGSVCVDHTSVWLNPRRTTRPLCFFTLADNNASVTRVPPVSCCCRVGHPGFWAHFTHKSLIQLHYFYKQAVLTQNITISKVVLFLTWPNLVLMHIVCFLYFPFIHSLSWVNMFHFLIEFPIKSQRSTPHFSWWGLWLFCPWYT